MVMVIQVIQVDIHDPHTWSWNQARYEITFDVISGLIWKVLMSGVSWQQCRRRHVKLVYRGIHFILYIECILFKKDTRD